MHSQRAESRKRPCFCCSQVPPPQRRRETHLACGRQPFQDDHLVLMCRQQRLQTRRVTHVCEQRRVGRPPRGRRHRAAHAAPAPGWPAALNRSGGTHSLGQQSKMHSASAQRRCLRNASVAFRRALSAPMSVALGRPVCGPVGRPARTPGRCHAAVRCAFYPQQQHHRLTAFSLAAWQPTAPGASPGALHLRVQLQRRRSGRSGGVKGCTRTGTSGAISVSGSRAPSLHRLCHLCVPHHRSDMFVVLTPTPGASEPGGEAGRVEG